MLVALATQHATRMHPINNVISGLPGSIEFVHIITQTARFSWRRLRYINCLFIFSTTLSETFLILRIIQRDTLINTHKSSCIGLILLRF